MLVESKKILKDVYGYDHFRDQQEAIIENILHKKDTIVLMPTGGGKSICFQIPAIQFEGITLVISPLISLMKDQVDALRALGVDAAFFNSTQSEIEKKRIIEQAKKKELKLLYLAPETLLPALNSWIPELEISLVAIDEAHCVSMWGHDFRPEYTQLQFLRKQYSNIPFVALTATADKLTRRDIEKHLGLVNPKTFLSSFDRPNIQLNIRGNLPKNKKIDEVLDFIDAHKDQSGIIYCLSRKETEEFASNLQTAGINADYYHAGLTADERDHIQTKFLNDEIQVICATIAFGMGIDKSNVRWVIHNNLPKNVEGYYQEIGRAGRDGLASKAILYYNYRDVKLLADFAQNSEYSKVLLEKLNRMLEFAEATTCRRKILLAYFGEVKSNNCENCDVCRNPQATFDGTELAQKALSAIKRAEENVGQTTVIEILRGAKTSEMFSKGFNTLKTFGIGADLSVKEWLYYLTQIKNLGLIEIAYDENMHLKISSFGNDVLFGKKKIQLAFYKEKSIEKGKKKTPKKEVSLSFDEMLFDRLKLLRRKIAVEENVPPYIIFHDTSLKEMSELKPTTENAMLAIQGVGLQKYVKYGEEFIALIQLYLNENKGKSKPKKKTTFEETWELIEAGKTLEEISELRSIAGTTIFSHLAKLYEDNYPIHPFNYIEETAFSKVKAYVSTLEAIPDGMKPIHEHFEGEIDYGTIRMSLAIISKENKS
jgi:ATP-dependent DNA helicase RecQ